MSVVSTNIISDITNTSFVSGGNNIELYVIFPILQKGVYWDINTINITIDPFLLPLTNKTLDGGTESDFISNVTGLISNTKYYICAYLTSFQGTPFAYGNELTTTTFANVATSNYSQLSSDSVILGGNVEVGGNELISERGICLSLTNNPTIFDKTVIGSGTGTFSLLINNLLNNTLYYYRAYCINDAGISYGTIKAFTTNNVIGYINEDQYLAMYEASKNRTCSNLNFILTKIDNYTYDIEACNFLDIDNIPELITTLKLDIISDNITNGGIYNINVLNFLDNTRQNYLLYRITNTILGFTNIIPDGFYTIKLYINNNIKEYTFTIMNTIVDKITYIVKEKCKLITIGVNNVVESNIVPQEELIQIQVIYKLYEDFLYASQLGDITLCKDIFKKLNKLITLYVVK